MTYQLIQLSIHATDNISCPHCQQDVINWAEEQYVQPCEHTLFIAMDVGFEYFSKCMNEYLNDNGLADARLEMPRAHAVARSQINIRALHSIKMQMRQNDWIIQSGRDDRQRMLWQLTPKGQKLLESNLLDNNRVFQFNSSY